MPRIHTIGRIVISMFFNDHNPPHVHAKFGDKESLVEIQTRANQGNLNRADLAKVKTWVAANEAMLLAKWEELKRG